MRGIIGLYFVAFLLANAFYIVVHENVHSTIGGQFGCIEEKIEYEVFGRSHWECLEWAKGSESVRSLHTVAQANAENTGYHIQALLNGIFLIGMFFLRGD